MKCSVCSCADNQVLETKVVDDDRTRRRRKCSQCGHRWTTYEVTESAMPKVDLEAALANVRSLEAILTRG